MRKCDLLGPLMGQTSLLIERLFLDSRHLRWVETNLNIWTYMRNWLDIYTLSKLAPFTSRLKQQNLLSSINSFSYIFAFCLYQRRLVVTTWKRKSKMTIAQTRLAFTFLSLFLAHVNKTGRHVRLPLKVHGHQKLRDSDCCLSALPSHHVVTI